MEKLAATPPTKDYFIRISDEWVNYVHKRKDTNFDEIYSVFIKMKEKTNLKSDEGDEFLRSIVNKNVKLQEHDRKMNFPGPMAVQLGRRHLWRLRRYPYWITEKSDGIRVMMLVLRSPRFPRWTYKDPNTNTYIAFSLQNTAAIETACQYKTEERLTSLRLFLDDGKYDFNRYELTLKKLVNDEPQEPTIEIRRETGWSFAYVFDRKYEMYLCNEEFIFPTYETIGEYLKGEIDEIIYQDVVLIDGEIVYNMIDDIYNYTVYDVVTCGLSPRTMNGPRVCVPKSYVNRSMGKRIWAIKHAIVDPHHAYYRAYLKTQPPRSLQIVCKHFYKTKEIEIVLQCITKDPRTNEYVYKGYNKNDGLVFTPDDPLLYPFKPGPNDYLLKWKWPDKLSSDFLVVPVDRENNTFAFYYWGMSFKIHYRDVIVDDDHSKEIAKSIPDDGAVVECGFNGATGNWYFELIRRDKTTGNGINVVANTLENIVENIRKEDLYFLKYDPTEHEMTGYYKMNEDDRLQLKIAEERNLVGYFCIGTRRDDNVLHLQFSINIIDKYDREKTIFMNYVKLEECIGIYEETENRIIKNVLHFSSTNRIPIEKKAFIVKCAFVPRLGRWKILSYGGRREDTHANNLLRTLEELCIFLHHRQSPTRDKKRKMDEIYDPTNDGKKRKFDEIYDPTNDSPY